jgi:putative transposase
MIRNDHWNPPRVSGDLHRRHHGEGPRRARNKPIYVVIGVTVNGERDILGLWAGDGGEGAKFWLAVLTELKNRGVADVCIAVCDGLKGLPDAINTVWDLATVQACILHLIRNTFRFASRKYWDQIAHDLRPVYTAASEAEALARFEEFEEKWGKPYPAISRLWRNAWSEFVPFLDYDVEIRKIICSTNAIWVLYLPAWVGGCFPGQSWKRPALTLNAIDAERLSWTRNVGPAA